jgi:DNA-binding transcriptional ArsR family regulator
MDGSIPDEFADVNEAVGAEWESETTPAERVRAVLKHAYEPVSADTVADDARVSPKTARKHLDALAEEGYARTEPGPNGGTLYARSPESLVVEEAAAILGEVSVEELTERIDEMRERVAEFRDEYGVDSPEDLAVVRANETLSGRGDATEITPDERREWQTTRRNLAFATAALSIANAERFVADSGSSGDGVAVR